MDRPDWVCLDCGEEFYPASNNWNSLYDCPYCSSSNTVNIETSPEQTLH